MRAAGAPPVDRDSRCLKMRLTLTEEVRARLLNDLHRGVFRVGDQLPAEEQLASRYGVSRATMREAVRTLIDRGQLSRRHGSGTFVLRSHLRRHSLEVAMGNAAMIAAAGMRAGSHLLTVDVRAAEPIEAEKLALADEGSVIALSRVRTADSIPAIYSVDAVVAARLPGVTRHQLEGSLYDLLEEFGAVVKSGVAILRAVAADDVVARNLALSPGVAMQFIEQVDYDGDGAPVIYSREWHTPDVLELCVHRMRTGAEMWTEPAGPRGGRRGQLVGASRGLR